MASSATAIIKFQRKSDGRIVDWQAPSDRDEVQRYMRDYFGIILAEQAVCPDHVAPLDVFCEAYFAEQPVIVWEGSRGLAGKSTMLAGLGALELLDAMDVTILGGSSQQSQRVHAIEAQMWNRDVEVDGLGTLRAPFRRFLVNDPATWHTKSVKGHSLIALTASTQSVRGPHPVRLRLDEADELDLVVFDAAMGQTLARDGHKPQTVISSTHQYPNGTFSEILRRAAEKNWGVRRWCYRESHVDNGGWLTQDEIERKRSEVTAQMWRVEYDLGEPTIEGRAFDMDCVDWMFNRKHGSVQDMVGKTYVFEKPKEGAKYATGADWAKDKDFTAIATIRYDVEPWRVVAYGRDQRRPWPLMWSKLDERLRKFPGRASHDATGLGDVIDDVLEEDVYGFKMVGARRHEMFTDVIKAVEERHIISPRIESLHKAVLYTSVDDLYGSGHPPDPVVALGLAVQAALGKNRDPKAKRPGRVGKVYGY